MVVAQGARMIRPPLIATALVLSLFACGPETQLDLHIEDPESAPEEAVVESELSTAGFTFKRSSSPAQTRAYRDGRWVATFTDGAYNVVLKGPERTFTDPHTDSRVRHTYWVRTYPKPFAGTVDKLWLARALWANDNFKWDLLKIATQYMAGADARYRTIDGRRVQYLGDACYGPLQEDGTRQEGSDFNDYLGLRWTYADGEGDSAEERQQGCLDCSGLVRMVWGYRNNNYADPTYRAKLPLWHQPRADRAAIPRRAFQIFDAAPGRKVIANRGVQVTDMEPLSVGDLVFFDVDAGDGPQIDHVGIYLGRDQDGRYRFIHSRKSANGPSMGDLRGASVLDGSGFYARGFRGARRL